MAFRAHPGDHTAQGAALNRLDRQIEANGPKTSYLMLMVTMPAFARLAEKLAVAEARRNVREGLVRLAEYRIRTGSFPRMLDDAGGGPLHDPFTGRPLLYRRTDRGFVLYSVGEDPKDDGGKGERTGPDQPVPDMVIEYPR